jgi:hypothetical protein
LNSNLRRPQIAVVDSPASEPADDKAGAEADRRPGQLRDVTFAYRVNEPVLTA